jgi:tryptophanase
MDNVPFANGGVTVNAGMGKQTASVTDLDVGAHISERTDFNTVTDDGTVGNNCSWMNTHSSISPF